MKQENLSKSLNWSCINLSHFLQPSNEFDAKIRNVIIGYVFALTLRQENTTETRRTRQVLLTGMMLKPGISLEMLRYFSVYKFKY